MIFRLSRCEQARPWVERGLSYSTPEMLATVQESKEATNFYFCYRWLLILFKREFSSYEEVSHVERAWAVSYHRFLPAALY